MNYVNEDNDLDERLSTNGYYTGQHEGTVTQDVSEGADNAPYSVERTSVRQGTIAQDAKASGPAQAFRVTYDLNGATGTLAVESEVAFDANKIKIAAAPTISTYPASMTRFTGWNTQAGGGGTSYTAEQTDVTLSADTVLYAQYAA